MAIALAFVIPVIFLLCGAMGRKLTRGSGWERNDFYLGVELALATFSADIIYVIDLVRMPPINGQKALTAAAALVFIFFIYLYLLTLHQDWEKQKTNRAGQIGRLVCLSNGLGIVVFAMFVFLVKGVSGKESVSR